MGIKRKRLSEEPGLDIPWTASRCNRLLRTLTSRISILQKAEKDRRRSGTSSNSLLRRTNSSDAGDDGSISQRNDSSIVEPSWLAGSGARPGARKVYKAKPNSTATPAKPRSECRAFKAGLPTPMIKRMLAISPRVQEHKSGQSRQTRAKSSGRVKSIPIKLTTCAAEAERNLVSAFDSFLRATAPNAVPPRTGTSSLRTACLNRVPRYIDLEQAALESHDPDDETDLSFEIYSELESLGSTSWAGWPGLRQIVRAHGLYKISEAMRNQVIPLAVAQQILDVSMRSGVTREMEPMLAALVERSDRTSSGAMSYCIEFARQYDLQIITRRLTGRLVKAGRLNIGEPCLDQQYWFDVAKAILEPRSDTSAHNLLEFYVSSIDGGLNSPRTNAIMSLPSLLVAMTLQDSSKPPPGQRSTRGPSQVLQILALNQALRQAQGVRIGRHGHNFIKANELSRACSTVSDPNLVDVNPRSFVDLEESFATGDGVNLVCDIARYLTKLDPSGGLHKFGATMKRNIYKPSDHTSSTDKQLSSMILEGVVAFAERSNTKCAFELAHEIELAASAGRVLRLATTPRRKLTHDPEGVRWDDSLCEWIINTPAALAPNVEDDTIAIFEGGEGVVESRTTRSPSAGGQTPEEQDYAAPFDVPSAEISEVDFVPELDLDNSTLSVQSAETELSESLDDDYDELALYASLKKRTKRIRFAFLPDVSRNINPASGMKRSIADEMVGERVLGHPIACADESDDELGF